MFFKLPWFTADEKHCMFKCKSKLSSIVWSWTTFINTLKFDPVWQRYWYTFLYFQSNKIGQVQVVNSRKLWTIILNLLASKSTHINIDNYMLHICQSFSAGVSAPVYVYGRKARVGGLHAGPLYRFGELSLPQKHSVGERVRHVNELEHGRVLKLETDLCSVRDQLYKGHTEQVSSTERAWLCRWSRWLWSNSFTTQSRHLTTDHFPFFHDISNFRSQWRHTHIELFWLIDSYRAFSTYTKKQMTEKKKICSQRLKRQDPINISDSAWPQSKMTYCGIKYPPQWSFPVDPDHSIKWDWVRGHNFQSPLITNILQQHRGNS